MSNDFRIAGKPASGIVLLADDAAAKLVSDGALVVYALRPGRGSWSLAPAPTARRA